MPDFSNTKKAYLLAVSYSFPGYFCMHCVLFLPINHNNAVVTLAERLLRNALARLRFFLAYEFYDENCSYWCVLLPVKAFRIFSESP